MRLRALAAGAIAVALLVPMRASGEIAVTDAHGRINSMIIDGEDVEVRTNLRLPTRGWQQLPSLDNARQVEVSREEGRQSWRGLIEIEDGKAYRYEQTLQEEDGAVILDLRVTAEADVDLEGVFFWLDVPIAVFAGGECELATGERTVASGVMPREQPQNRHFLRGNASRARLSDAAASTVLEVQLDRACPATVQDNREYRGTTYSAFFQVFNGGLPEGGTASLRVTLRLTGEVDDTPAALTLDANRVRYRLDGFGGNYCFNIESPVTQYTLDNLPQGWARTEMTPGEWEPENDNQSPTETDWAYLESHDGPGSNLRREFLLAKQIQERGIPYCISIWHLPEWLYAEPGKGPSVHRRRVHPDKWPELLEALGSYLLYAKRQYGVEPDLFSFNEANIGVRVLFSAEEHREAIKSIGAHFQKLGLKTKMLLADATGPRGTHTYALPAANDPEAMRYVGAVGFHSWGGASPEQYQAWADLAERLKLPLLVTELGVDAGAWRTRAFDTFHYALREVGMYQEILLYARPQGTMQWEFTSDYGIVKVENVEGRDELVPTVRFWFVKHFCGLTPLASEALGTTSDHPKVLFTAFRGTVGARQHYTLHIANLAAERHATLSGLPSELRSLRAVRTSETDSFRELPAVPVADGRASVDLAARSLLTLTTLPAE
ncbi:MAG: hypothetical protein ACE5R4_08785 [Armatimonadota bacterium]